MPPPCYGKVYMKQKTVQNMIIPLCEIFALQSFQKKKNPT